MVVNRTGLPGRKANQDNLHRLVAMKNDAGVRLGTEADRKFRLADLVFARVALQFRQTPHNAAPNVDRRGIHHSVSGVSPSPHRPVTPTTRAEPDKVGTIPSQNLFLSSVSTEI